MNDLFGIAPPKEFRYNDLKDWLISDQAYRNRINSLIKKIDICLQYHPNSGTLFNVKNMLHQELERLKDVDPRPKSDK